MGVYSFHPPVEHSTLTPLYQTLNHFTYFTLTDKEIPALRKILQCFLCCPEWRDVVRWDDGKDGEWVGPALPGPEGVLGLIGLGLRICVLNWDYHVIQRFAGKSTQQWDAEFGAGVRWPPAWFDSLLPSPAGLLCCVYFVINSISLCSVPFCSFLWHFILFFYNLFHSALLNPFHCIPICSVPFYSAAFCSMSSPLVLFSCFYPT